MINKRYASTYLIIELLYPKNHRNSTALSSILTFNKTFLIFLLILSIGMGACTTTKPAGTTATEEIEEDLAYDDIDYADEDDEDFQNLLDSFFQEDIKPGVFQSKATIKWNLIHTKLDLSFDWEKQRVNGKANLTMVPYFFPDSIVVLDAKNFDIHFIGKHGSKDTLDYSYDNASLTIPLKNLYKNTDTLHLSIHYTAKPAEREDISGGSAITSDQGLFFINHDGSLKGKPQQIWTQGETEFNSSWFPTFDKPNHRCTQEMILTVEDRFTTLSNGKLMSSNKNGDGTRTDHWKMDLPHAPYLFMLAIGEYAIVKDKWKHLELGYYVEPAYKAYAKDIFAHTPEMLTFFSQKFGMEYPWQKYDQVVVRDYVSGAMENTTAVIFGDFVQRTKRQLMDNPNDKIVAHELAHHWFGNLVTCANWSQLTLNEGFANYSEYLWMEHKYGKQEAELHRQEELHGYMQSVEYTGTKNLIRYDYESSEEMFDAHSYNKGGLILHMLRNITGDEAFFASLKYYLEQNAFKPVEVHQLRLAFEEVTGVDYSWFFDQWFMDKGHITLKVDQVVDEGSGKIYLTAYQLQEAPDHRAVFTLPLDIDIYLADGRVIRDTILMTSSSALKELHLDDMEVIDVIFDPDRLVLGTIEENWDLDAEACASRFRNQNHHYYKLQGLSTSASLDEDLLISLCTEALDDDFWLVRLVALNYLPEELMNELLWDKTRDLALNDPHLNVRAIALEKLSTQFEEQPAEFFEKILEKGERENGQILGMALGGLYSVDRERGLILVDKLIEDNDHEVITALTEIFVAEEDTSRVEFLLDKYKYIEGYEAITYMTNTFTLLEKVDYDTRLDFSTRLYEWVKNYDSKPMQRFGIMQFYAANLALLSNDLQSGSLENFDKTSHLYEKLLEYFEQIKKMETNSQLLSAYEYLRS